MDTLLTKLLVVAGVAAERWGPLLATAAVKGAVMLGVAALAARAMRGASAAMRHLLWSATVAGVLALPVIEAVAPRWTAPVVPPAVNTALSAAAHALWGPADNSHREPSHARHADADVVTVPRHDGPRDVPYAVAHDVPHDVPNETRVVAGPRATAADVDYARATAVVASAPVAVEVLTVAPASADVERAASPLTWAMLVWAAGAAFVLLRLAFGTYGLSRLARRARPADNASWVLLAQRLARELGIRRPVTLLVGRTGTVPVTWGVVYPVVLLPADADTWGEERRRAVLLHELAHVERFDALTHVLSQLALALFWFNPLVALAARRLRAERERACDDVVLAVGTRATDYAGDLLDLVQTLGDAGHAPAALAMARRSEFEGRLLAILDPAVPRARASRRATLGAALCAVGAVVPLAGMRPAVAAPRGEALAPAPHDLPNEPAVARASVGADEPFAPAAPFPPFPPPAATPAAERGTPVAEPAALAPPPPAQPPSFDRSLAALAAGLDTLSAGLVRTRDVSRQALAAPTRDGCSRVRGRYTVDDGTPARTFRVVADGRCLEIHATGAVEFTDDYADVRSLAPGAVLTVTETRDGATRKMVLSQAGRVYSFDGDTAAFPAADRAAWLRRVFREGVRDSGFDTDTRVERLRREGGVARVLAAAALADEKAKRRYLERLLDGPALDDDALRDVARLAQQLTSDGDKAALLGRVARRGGTNPSVGMAVVTGANTLTSDGDRRRVLEQAAEPPTATLAVLTQAARAVSGMTSDGDKAAVLLKLAPRAAESAAMRAAFFDAVGSMVSNGDRRRVVLAVLRHHADDTTAAAAVGVARNIVSDGDRTAILRAVAASDALASPAVREPFFKTVRAMASESSREDALTAAVRARPADLAVAVAASNVAAEMASSSAKANVLLEVATRTPALKDDAARAALFAALKTVSSSSEYRRVMEAVVR